MTYQELGVELDQLAGLPFAPADYRTHWLGLQDLPRDVLAGAVQRAARVCERFPSPPELRALADQQRPVVSGSPDRPARELETPLVVDSPLLGKPIRVTREWSYVCDVCSDGGWESLWCGDPAGRKPWQALGACGRTREHLPHEWVTPCVCRERNPEVQRQRQAQARYAEQRTARGGRP